MWRLLFLLLVLAPGLGRRTVSVANAGSSAPIGCGPAPSSLVLPDADGRFAPVFPGWGHYHYPISSTSDSAQFYFDQGLSLYYSYHLTESLASFKEASAKDSNCVMTWWGQALAMGPYYNNTYTYKMPAEVLPVLATVRRLSAGAAAREKDLVSAMGQRYSTDVTDSRRTALNHAYSEAMKKLIGKYPGDKDIKALYIDGVMSEHAWDMYDPKGEPKAWTPELVKFCEDILAADSLHPAALHYHVHLVEASYHPEVSLASADKLKDLMPGVPHMVHMASHSYQRTGLFAKGAYINDSANAAQRLFVSLAPNLRLNPAVIHYYAVESYCALTGGMYAKAMQEAEECKRIAIPRLRHSTTYLQYLSMMPVFVDVRMGKWESILGRTAPDDSLGYAAIIDNFARGLAYVRTGNVAAASVCLDKLKLGEKDPVLAEKVSQGNSPIVGAQVAEGILEGELLFAQGKMRESMEAFQRAMEVEDGMAYVEPKDWLLPARHFLGAHLLKLGKVAEAEVLYRTDLIHNPGNGWSLIGLVQSLEAQNKKGTDGYRARAKEAFGKAEEVPPASAY